MDEEFKKRLIDRLEGWELVELLNINIEDIIHIFSDDVEEHQIFLEEYLNHGR